MILLYEHVYLALGEVARLKFSHAGMISPRTYAKFCRRGGFEEMAGPCIKAYVEALSQEHMDELIKAFSKKDETLLDNTVSDVLFEYGEHPQRFIENEVAGRLLVGKCFDYWSTVTRGVKLRARFVEVLKFIRLQAQAIRERELKECVSTLPLLKRP